MPGIAKALNHTIQIAPHTRNQKAFDKTITYIEVEKEEGRRKELRSGKSCHVHTSLLQRSDSWKSNWTSKVKTKSTQGKSTQVMFVKVAASNSLAQA